MLSKLGSDHVHILGAGPEWTDTLGQEISDQLHHLKCIEIIPENFFDNPSRSRFLDRLAETGTPVLVHAIGLSLASDEALKRSHLQQVMGIADRVNAVNLSDHLSMTEAGGTEIGQLTPMPWTTESADVVIRKIEAIKKIIKMPFVLEHVAYRFFYPFSELTEPEYINRILDATGCELMLDLHNLHCNSQNAGYDPTDWLNEVNIERATVFHLAGGYQSEDGTLQDGHNSPVPPAVWRLLDVALARVIPQAIIVERTGNYPGLGEIMDEIYRAEKKLSEAVSRRSLLKRGLTPYQTTTLEAHP